MLHSRLARLLPCRRPAAALAVIGLMTFGAACRPEAEALLASPSDQPAEPSSPIVLRGRVIDTDRPPPEVDPELEAAPSRGDQLMLIQFSDGVRDEWLEEVAAQGRVDLVTYLPENAYLIWTDGATVEGLRRLLAERSFLRWLGPFHPAYKLAPGLPDWRAAAASDEVAVTVQLVAHDGVGASEEALLARSRKVLRPGWTVGAYRNLRLVVPQRELAAIAALPDVVNLEPWLEPRLQPPGARPPAVGPADEREPGRLGHRG